MVQPTSIHDIIEKFSATWYEYGFMSTAVVSGPGAVTQAIVKALPRACNNGYGDGQEIIIITIIHETGDYANRNKDIQIAAQETSKVRL